MTEIVAEEMEFKAGKRYCAVDNHRRKNGKSYDILYVALTELDLRNYMIEKGIWERGFFTFICFGIISNIYSVKLFL